MFVNNLNPVIFEFFGIQIRWYGLVYVLAFVTLYVYLKYLIKNKKIHNLKENNLEEFLIGLIISMIVGARLFHVFVYYPTYYFSNPLEIFMIWNGGLSFHGALILVALWVYYFCKKYKIHFLNFTDYLVFPIAIFLAIGRMTNYVNGELVGKVTNVSWGVYFNNSNYEGIRHPTQIYESIKNLILFGVLLGLKSFQAHFFRRAIPGLLTAVFLIGYGSLRFMIEFMKESAIIILGLNMGQILSIATLLFGIYLLRVIFITKKSFKNIKKTKKKTHKKNK